MKFSASFFQVLACFVASATTVSAVEFTKWPAEVHTGEPATIKWAGDPDAPVTITLQQGPPENLKDVKVLSPDAHGGSFTWVPGAALPESADYAFKISQGGEVNYSGQIKVLGGPKDAPEVKQKVQEQSSTSSDVSSSQDTATQTSSMATTSSISESQTNSTTTATTVSSTTASDTQATSASNGLAATAATTSAPVQSSSASPASQTAIASPTSAGIGASGNAVASKTQLSTASLRQSPGNWVLGALGFVVFIM